MTGLRPPRPRGSVLFLAATALAPVSGLAADVQPYTLDPVHTRVVFAVSHAGFSRALGTISGSSGTLHFDRDDWTTARLDVTVPVARLDLGDAKWNAATLASGLLDGRRHPEARFVSSRVEPIDANRARVCGELTLRGTTGPFCLDVTLNALKRHPLPPFRRTAGFSATGSLSRATFGIDAWPSVIGDEVELTIEAEATAGIAPPGAAGTEREQTPVEVAPEAESTDSPPADTPPAEVEPPTDEVPVEVPPGLPTPPPGPPAAQAPHGRQAGAPHPRGIR